MAVIKQGILGGFSGKVGNVVGSSWKGINVMKSMPVSVANPKTAAQTAQRGKFANAVAFSKEILAEVIKPLWDRFAIRQSGYNQFISRNVDRFDEVFPSPPADLVMSEGPMAATPISELSMGLSGVDTYDVTWTDDSGEGLKLATDQAYLVVYNKTKGTLHVSAGTATRNAEIATASTYDWEAGDEYMGWLSFRRADGTVVSESSFSVSA